MGLDMSKFSRSGSSSSSAMAFHSSESWKLHFNSSKDLNKLVSSLLQLPSNSAQIMVVDFTATWCGPGFTMEPVIEEFIAKYPDVLFVKIDVDELSDVSSEFGVTAMPTFVLLKKGKEVERVVGAKKEELEPKILKHRELSS